MSAENWETTPKLKSSSPENSCVFCKILAGELPGRIVLGDHLVSAFWDAHPAAEVHILIIPNRHISSINDLVATDEGLAGHMVMIAQRIATEQGISQSGYRLLANNGRQAGQSIDHLHFHLLSADLKRPIG